MSRALPESPVKARRRRRRALLIYGTWALCMTLGVGAIALAHAPFLRIQTVSLSGSTAASSDALQTFVHERLTGRYYYLFPRDNAFWYPKEELVAALAAAYPSLYGVETRTRGFTTLEVSATDRQPRALWCGELPEFPEPCQLLDEHGIAYAAAPGYPEHFNRYYGALGAPLPEAPSLRPFLQSAQFRSLAASVDAVAEQAGESVQYVAVDGERDVRVRFANDFLLLFSAQDQGSDVLERYMLALQAEPLVGKALTEIEYLDLRFGDRLYYKVR